MFKNNEKRRLIKGQTCTKKIMGKKVNLAREYVIDVGTNQIHVKEWKYEKKNIKMAQRQ